VQPTIEAFDKGILHRLAWCDVMPALPFDPTRPESLSSQFGTDI
jgi:hypothetical protein